VGVEPTVEVDQPEYFYTNPVQIEEPLVYDNTGTNVENIQLMLKGLDYTIERTDGYFDKVTEDAVKEFQEDNDLEVSGKVDQETAGMMEAKIIEKIRSGEDDVQLDKALEVLYQ